MGSSGERIPANSQASQVSKVMMNERPFLKQGEGEASDLLVLVHTMCIDACARVCTHTHTNTQRHTYRHTQTHAYTHIHSGYTHTYSQAHIHTGTHRHMPTHMYSGVHTYTHTYTHTIFKSSVIFPSKRSGLSVRLINPEDPTRPS